MLLSKIGIKFTYHPTTEQCKPTELVESCAQQSFCCSLTGKTTAMKNQEYTQQEYFQVNAACPFIVPWLWPAESINYTKSDFLARIG